MVRPLGFVTLYFAYAESQLDEVLKALTSASGSREVKVLTFGSKVGEAVKLVEKVGAKKLQGLSMVLDEARPLIEAMNELVHGQLFNGGRLVTKLGTRRVSPHEIADLAERIFSWKERLWERYWRELVLVASQAGVTTDSVSEDTLAQQRTPTDVRAVASRRHDPG